MFTNFEKLLRWKYLDYLILTSLFLAGFLLRIYLIDKNLFFGPEQGRDLLVVKDIAINHKLVLIGSKTDIEGIFHGPLFYYLATIPFLISKGSPLFIELFFILLSALSIFLLYLLTKELFNRKIAMISSTLFTFSFGSIVMSRWLSNPPLTIPISCLFFLFLVKFLKGKNYYLVPVAICFGLVSQAELVNFLIFSFILFFVIIIFWKRFIKQNILNLTISFGVLMVTTLANFLLFDLRHQFLITNSFTKLLTKHSGYYGTLTGSISNSANNFIHFFYDLVVPFYPLPAILIFAFGIFSLMLFFSKNKIAVYIMLIWIFSPLIAFVTFKYNSLYHYFAAVLIALIILTSVLIDRIWSFKNTLGFSLLVLLVAINIFAFLNYLPTNRNVFFQSTQPDLRYSDQKAVISEIYREANGKPFYFQSYTIPYWFQDGWEYLVWYYGKNVYGYVPINKDTKSLFVIIQNDPGNKLYQKNWLTSTVSEWGIRENEFAYGALKVQRLKAK